MHAIEMFEIHHFTIVDGGALDKSLRQCTQLARRLIPHQQCAVRRVVEIEDRDVRARIDLAHLGMDDLVDAQNEWAGRRVGTEKIRIALHEDGHGPPSEPAQHVGWRHRQPMEAYTRVRKRNALLQGIMNSGFGVMMIGTVKPAFLDAATARGRSRTTFSGRTLPPPRTVQPIAVHPAFAAVSAASS